MEITIYVVIRLRPKEDTPESVSARLQEVIDRSPLTLTSSYIRHLNEVQAVIKVTGTKMTRQVRSALLELLTDIENLRVWNVLPRLWIGNIILDGVKMGVCVFTLEIVS